MEVDSAGRLYVATRLGIQVCDQAGRVNCILPGIFPVVLSGTVLWALGEGLQFASVVALTVSSIYEDYHWSAAAFGGLALVIAGNLLAFLPAQAKAPAAAVAAPARS